MARLFYHTMQDNAGNLLFGVSGTMRFAGTGTLATIYGDEALTVILPNPMTNHVSFASFKCFLPVGDFDFYMAKAGYTFETLTGVQGYGTMAQQEANAVNITGGVITGSTITGGTVAASTITAFEGFSAPQNTATNAVGYYTNMASGGSNRWAFFGASDGPSSFGGNVIITPDHTLRLGTTTPAAAYNSRAEILYTSTITGMQFRPNVDTGPPTPLAFRNAADSLVGSITTTGAATAYNTTSDARLKFDVTPLAGALDVVRALKPVSFLWKADGTPGVSFLAHEVQDVIPDGVITGERDGVDADGNVQAQMMDMSKLVPWLVSAVKELTQQVEALTAQLATASA